MGAEKATGERERDVGTDADVWGFRMQKIVRAPPADPPALWVSLASAGRSFS